MENPFSLDLLKVHYIAKGLCIYIEKWHPLHPTAIYSWRLEMDGCDEFRASRKCWEISDKAERSQILPKMEISLANLLKQLLAIYLKWNATSWRLYIYILTDWRVQGFTNEERDQRLSIHLEDLHKNGKNHFMSGTRVPTAISKDKRLYWSWERYIHLWSPEENYRREEHLIIFEYLLSLSLSLLLSQLLNILRENWAFSRISWENSLCYHLHIFSFERLSLSEIVQGKL